MGKPDPQFPDDAGASEPNRAVEHDLDPNIDGNLTLQVGLERTQALLVSANSTDGEAWSASVTWLDADGNEFVSESATEIGLNAATNDWARLVRKGPTAEVTFTSDAGAGTQNQINAFVDAHR